jgi:uncharacterized UPF0160 family protein
MSIFKKNKICVTHNGAFHTDDLFATATLSILNNGNIKIIRTRDPKIIEKGDYVYDVGGNYDPLKNIFDHHQKGGAGDRENGIPYSSFGLIWKEYGEKICGDKDVAMEIDRKIAEPIDAIDNGMDLTESKFKDTEQYTVNDIFKAFYPTWDERMNNVDEIFEQEVEKIIPLLKREIEVAQSNIIGTKIIMEDYNKAEDKRIVILSKPFHRFLVRDVLPKLPEPIYYICPSGHSDGWKVETVNVTSDTMESRKLFPLSWRGFTDSDPKLREVTGVDDIIFCHKSGYLLNVKSKEGAIALAQKALLA